MILFYYRQAQLREDAAHHVHVCGVTQVEVKSAREAFELVCLGQKRLHVAKTQTKHMSSRGHSVFTITLVQVNANTPHTHYCT